MTEMNARLRAFLDEVRDWFWAHPYVDHGGPMVDSNDLMMAVGNVLRAHPELTSTQLLQDLIESDLGGFLDLSTNDPDVSGVFDKYDDVKSMADDLMALVVREILRNEDRPEDWESLPLDQEDGPTAKEDKRRLELSRQAMKRPWP